MPRDSAHLHVRTPRAPGAQPVGPLEAPAADQAIATRHAVPVAGIARPARSIARKKPAGAADPLGGTAAAPEVVSALRRRRGAGSPLPEEVSQRFGEQLGTDLSAVRVHTDAEADRVSRSVGAQAFTHGTDIYFTSGTYQSGPAGQRLLAHELAHVAQNAAGRFRSGSTGTEIGRADDPAERDADRTADQVLSALRRTPAPDVAPEELSGSAADGSALAVRRLPWGELGGFVEGLVAQALFAKKRKKRDGNAKHPAAAAADVTEVQADEGAEPAEAGATPETAGAVAGSGVDRPAPATEAVGTNAGDIQPHVERIKTYWQLIRKIDDLPPAGTAQWDKAAATLGNEIKQKVRAAGRRPGGGHLGADFAAEIATISLPTDFRVLAGKLANEHWRCVEHLKRQDFPVHNDGSMDLPRTATGEYDFSRRTISMLTTKEEQEPFKISFRNGLLYRSAEYSADTGGHDETSAQPAPKSSSPSLVDTLGGVTQTQGLGWQMFVISRTGSWYVASQKLDRNHSSLLGGADVAMAGELKVRAGRIQELSNRSTASDAERDQVMNMLVSLHSRGVDMNFPVSGYKGIEAGSNAQALLAKAGALGKVNPIETFNAIAAMDNWQPLVDEFGQDRFLDVIAAHGWRTDGNTTVLDAQRATVTLRKAGERLKLDPSATYAAIKALAAWSNVLGESSEVSVLKTIEAESWHVDRGAVRNRSGTKVSPDQGRRKLAAKRRGASRARAGR